MRLHVSGALLLTVVEGGCPWLRVGTVVEGGCLVEEEWMDVVEGGEGWVAVVEGG